MDSVPIPTGCIPLNDAFDHAEFYSVIGVCVDYFEVTKSRGTDYMTTLKLHDATWNRENGSGMNFRLFNGNPSNLPVIGDQGDVVIFRNFKNINRGETMGISNRGSKWVVLPATALASCDNLQDMHRRATWSGKNNPSIPWEFDIFSEDELRYAKWLADQEDPSQWRPVLASTALQREHIMSTNGGNPPPRGQKFRLIKDLEVSYNRTGTYADLLGEVRHIYSDDYKTDLRLTDYTTNEGLYEFRFGDPEAGRDGDLYGYTDDSNKKWPGPWGRMTMTLTLWDAHHNYARANVKEGTFVYLRNVQIKLGRNGSNLEGFCRGDKDNPSRSNVEVRKPHEAQSDDHMKSLLIRKREYEEKAKAENIRFIRNAQAVQKRQVEEADEPKSKKARLRNRKKRENKVKHDTGQRPEGSAADTGKSVAKLNGNVRCENVNVPCKTVIDILDDDNLVRTTAQGTTFKLPFQNCRYRANVRVVDFFPDDIADFAAPREYSEYDYLSDGDNGRDSDIDLNQGGGNDVSWEWRFFLLVEDARQQQASRDGRPARMELLVANTDGDYLLNMEACDLRSDENARELAKVKEKLFHLWGDLQEKKEETAMAGGSSWKPSARPFQCLIKEYGVPTRTAGGRSRDSLSYERVFGLFGTTI
ncbi:hypothetical protein A1O1_02954 [Capronia coronata CBS 617.96]|uniref:Protection of telomeres protein 1 n=1 Tax=Capronia coronata CBS 617.96 TaxID=1182541 RepID=W9YPS8_9EURO|nr:uncharacterized protein A1O1_02954 [Capronia coronata CBS 617.96]EXJ94558.1 hypothetical protein A1O1_02954 [Capronia coronata CBS 617.96]